MNKITKAVIPAAGLGTRFLPATKTIPKEMLTIVDKPIILYIVEEAVRAGIEDIVIIAGRQKQAIEDFFDCSYELEDTLLKSGKEDLLNKINHLKSMANIISVRQKQALGLGHAVWTSKAVIGDEPFAVLLGDEIMISPPDKASGIGQLCHLYSKTHKSTVAVMEVAPSEVHKYGIIDHEPADHGLFKVKSVVEKPSLKEAPSQFALPGRYVFNSDIFKAIEDSQPGKNGEIQLTDGMTTVAKTQGLYATRLDAERFDAGDKLGYLQANIQLALRNPELKSGLTNYLKELVQQI